MVLPVFTKRLIALRDIMTDKTSDYALYLRNIASAIWIVARVAMLCRYYHNGVGAAECWEMLEITHDAAELLRCLPLWRCMRIYIVRHLW